MPFDGCQVIKQYIQANSVEVHGIDQPQVGQVVHHVERCEVGDVDEVDAAQVQLGDAAKFADAGSNTTAPPSISAASDVWFSTVFLARHG